jgi:hypothetical protein
MPLRLTSSRALFQLIENAAYSFELLLYKAKENSTDNVGSAMEKSRHMVLKVAFYPPLHLCLLRGTH